MELSILIELDEVLWLLNYAASHPDATIRYTASNVVLHIHSNASYFSETKARTRAGGHYLLSDRSLQPNQPPKTSPLINSPIYTVSTIMSNFMSSAAEADIGATFINLQESVPIQTTLA